MSYWDEKANEKRDRVILVAALKLAETVGYQWITRAEIAEAAGISRAGVSNFGCDKPSKAGPRGPVMLEIKRAVMREAVRTGNLVVIAQGLADRSPIALEAPAALRRRALAELAAA